MKHPGQAELALYAGEDLGLVARWRVAAHAAQCQECRREVELFRESSGSLREHAANVPRSLNWDGLAAEMRANILLGLAAGEVVARPRLRQETLGWGAAVALAALTLAIVSGWWLYIPKMQRQQAPETGVTVAVRGDGVELRDGAAMLMLMHPKSKEPGDVTVSVEADGAARARYVDEQSGQVTINNVSAE